ncbi:Ecdysteroid kinase-like family [Popillia japonica]|uniref:Ecdysteroid kinase-like family n=1 Tax=Popillia japonica TaxID=7064 RepID=A0AAW1NAJ6_POPJA
MNGAKQVPELEPFLAKIEKLVEFGLDDMIKGSEPNKLFATIVHSDYWLSNTMVLQDESGKPIKNKIVDLQIMQYSSCIRDLVFFLFTSVMNEDLDENYDKLLDLYCDTFVEYLKDFKLDTKEYTREAFRKEIEIIGPKEFYHVGFMLKPILTEKGKVESFENFQSSDWCREDLLGEAHKRKLKQLVFSYQKRNWI